MAVILCDSDVLSLEYDRPIICPASVFRFPLDSLTSRPRDRSIARRKSRIFSHDRLLVGRFVIWIRKSDPWNGNGHFQSRKLGHRFARFPFTITFLPVFFRIARKQEHQCSITGLLTKIDRCSRFETCNQVACP